ncbi:MAG: hypothetical protein APF76_04725 [Desulfitibacter sp. BRH_c19]|nr:MAG: hypothetical protein APF76_04725 [Desulfitibacter sp. BRH_c19]
MNHSKEVLNLLASKISTNRQILGVLQTIINLEAENNGPIIKKKIYENSPYSPKVVDNAVSFLEGGLLLDHVSYGTKHEYSLTDNGREVAKIIYRGSK